MPASLEKTEELNVFLYDGDCGFCDATVMFLLSKTKAQHLYFAPLQTSFAHNLFSEQGLPTPDLRAAYLWKNGKMYKASSAVLKSLSLTTFPYCLLSVFLIIPPFIRDFFYYAFASIRKKVPAFQNSCRLLSIEERKRFI
jgi:predicted DCC family thiol-disulfide oxidoreductase YuxK